MNACIHCDEPAPLPIYNQDDLNYSNPFCCHGCRSVYNVIHQKGLSEYYKIKNDSNLIKRKNKIHESMSKFTYLDDQDFLREYSYSNECQEKTLDFYLEGIHCLACLWLIEKLPDFVPNVSTARLNIANSTATISLKNDGLFSKVANELNLLGYRPHALKKNQNTKEMKLKEERSMLLRIGIAGAASGNIMLYAFSLYAGATAEYSAIFNFLTVFFAIPVLTYSAFPFYKNAWYALRNKSLDIDVPISLALILGGVMGISNLIRGIHDNYFDSLTALVFLLLMARYFLYKIKERGLDASDMHFFYQSESVLKAIDNNLVEFKEIHPKYLIKGDIVRVRPNEFIPADGIILSGKSYVNNSLLTGESKPVKCETGDHVLSGTQNIQSDLIIRIDQIQSDTRLGNILKNVENGWGLKSKTIETANTVSRYFVAATFIFSFMLFFYHALNGRYEHGVESALTLLIVTCPCALAIAIPLTFTRSLSRARERGIIIKDDSAIEKIAQIKTIFFDKTGTLTYGKQQIINPRTHFTPQISIANIIYNLEKNSHHPVALALMEYISSDFKNKVTNLNVNEFIEIPGLGVQGVIENHFYEIKNKTIFENHKPCFTFEMTDQIQSDTHYAIEQIRGMGLDCAIVSGDNSSSVNSVAKKLGINPQNTYSNVSPEEKNEIIKKNNFSMMVGDGANDAIAFSHARASVAVMGAMDISLRAADVYLSQNGLSPLVDLILISKETMKVINRNLVLSVTYNLISVYAVYAGIITPLVAAIVMPLSSLTVLISTLVGTKKLRAIWKS